MKFRKIAVGLSVIALTNAGAPTIRVFANEVNQSKTKENISYTRNIEETKAVVSKFEIEKNERYEEYKKAFKVESKKIQIKANKPDFKNTKLEYMTDEDKNTFWAPSTRDSADLKTEVEYVFDEVITLDRIIYSARQNVGTDLCGFPHKFEIYGTTDENEEYELVASGSDDVSTKETIEIKFKATEFKKLKFKFIETTDRNKWPHVGEIGFLVPDKVTEDMNNLFTDYNKNQVSEKYSSIEALNQLEKDILGHPFYDTYKVSIEDAKILVENDKAVATESKITPFGLYENEAYNNVFKMDNSNIKLVKNNAGSNSRKPISYATDGDINTAWESNTVNSDTFKNEVEIEFNEKVILDRVVYGARQNDSKGFAEEFEIYGSKTANGDTYELISTGKYNAVKGLIEAKFEPTEFKRIKFKFTKSKDDWATVSEFAFYKEDKLSNDVNSIFIDKLHTELSKEYNTIEKIESLEENIKTHPIKDELMEIINEAKAILNGSNIEASEIITLSQRGDENVQKKERRRVYAGGNLDLTGYYVMPGESLEVYVDASEKDKLPALVFAQVGEIDNNNKGNYGVALTVGKNIVTAPQGTTKGYAIYFTNKALPNEQEYAPKVRIKGSNLKKYPVYIHGKTDPNEYKEAVKNHQGANMTDVSGDRFLISAKNSEAKIAYIDNGYSPIDTAREIEEMISIFDMIGGYDENDENPIHRPSNALYHLKMTNGSGLFASNSYTHLGASSARNILAGTSMFGWGNLHEFGHQVESSDMRLLEVTNNIYSIMAEITSGKSIRNLTGTQKNLDRYFTFEGTKGFGGFGDSYELTFGLFERLLVLTQVTNYFGIESYGQANRLVRENPSRYATGKYQAIISALSEATGYDLSEHFEYYNYPVADKTKEFTSQFKKLDKKIRYTTLDSYEMNKNNAEIFTKETKAVINDIKTEEDGFTLNIGTNDNHKSTVAYEIYRDGEFVGFSRETTYKDVVDTTKSYDYEVIAYDYKVNESIKSEVVNSNIGFKPQINIENKNISIRLNDEFNPLAYISPKSYNGETIDVSSVEILENNVDISKKGTYKVIYKLSDRGQSVTDEINFEVVSDIAYASDVKWESATSGWKTVNKDKAVGSENKIKLNVDGEIKEFKKGIGAATNSEIVYDLSDKEYDYFETYVGVDKNYADQQRTTIDFKILADGKEVYKSETMKTNSKADYVKIELEGVKELKLIADNHDNDGYGDFASWGDAKFITTNSKPTLEIPKSKSVKVGEGIEDVIGKFRALDTEDGDLTDKVVVSGHDNINFNKPGEYKITYSVTDADGNTVSKERNIAVVDMKDFNYLTNYDWISAKQSYSTTKKDTNMSGGKLSLTDEDGKEVVYDRGIGSHATATIIYDLSDKNYEYFTSFIGVDRVMYNRPGSVSFEVHVDGEKKYDSGLMNAKDPQKYVEVDINGAKELKLIVTDGKNGNGSDHATWGDAKLHFVNTERADLTSLKEAIEKAEAIDASEYTEESIKQLNLAINEVKELFNADFVSQEQCDKAIQSIEEAINNLEVVYKVVTIEDKALEKEIKRTLNIGDREITLADMHKLVSLECAYGYVRNLNGLEYAVNLETLNIDFNEVNDISAIKNLKKLKNFSGKENFIENSNEKLLLENGKFIIEDVVIDANGERILPKEVVLSPRNNPIKLDLNEVLVGNKVVIDSSLVEGTEPVEILYEAKNHDYELYTFTYLRK